MSTPVLLSNLQRQLGGVAILKGISAQLLPGQVVALLGKNGAGKTTLLETILGFGFPSGGQVTLWGKVATDIDGETKQRIGFVPQQDELLPSLTAKDHLNLFKSFRLHWNQSLADRLIEEWAIPTAIAIGKLSVGQRQKLSILLALAHEPELLILDEPAASLDPIARRQFLQQLVDVAADENRAVIFSTHIVSDVERVANQVWMLREGVLAYQGGLDELKESVARVTVNTTEKLPDTLDFPDLIHKKMHGNTTQLTFMNWSDEREQLLASQLCSHIDVQHLGLEDIFLEMNL